MKNWLIVKLGGYVNQETVCDRMHSWPEYLDRIKRSNNETAKNEILTEAVKDLFNTIGPDDILRIDSEGNTIFQERMLLPDEIRSLREEAKMLTGSKLWKVIEKDVKFQLNRKMYLEANITTDMLWGKLLTYFYDIIQTRLNKLSK